MWICARVAQCYCCRLLISSEKLRYMIDLHSALLVSQLMKMYFMICSYKRGLLSSSLFLQFIADAGRAGVDELV